MASIRNFSPAVRLGVLLVCAALGTPAAAQQHLRRPSGQPYLDPAVTPSRFKLPEGFKAVTFAGEPELANPIAFDIDERGRVWVLECFEYPLGAPPGQKPRDRIKIFEDTDGDGRADRVKIFAEGFDLATGLAVGHGGVFVGVAPNLLFLRDLDGDDRADTQEVLLTGWGRDDTHELLNTFTWGPDGWLYGLHGVFTRSEVAGIYLDAAVWRYHPRLKRFELFAEGTSNPWGIDFDSRGRMFLTACVIPHLFYMIPGGRYIRQAGQNRNPYDYGQLREISDHLHHEESGWAHAGLVVLEGDLWPRELQGSIIMGSIHGCSIKRDWLEPRGSGFVAHHAPDFLRSGDRNVRPVNIRVGPDGALYVIDWHDQWPCHQTPPELWDKKRGRVYKIIGPHTKSIGPFDLSKRTSSELVELLDSANPWWVRTVLRLLAERRDRSVAGELRARLYAPSSDEVRALRALWGLFVTGSFEQEDFLRCTQSRHEWVRAWAVRLAVDAARNEGVDIAAASPTQLAADPSPHVRLALASACQRVENTTWAREALQRLALNDADADDPNLPLMIWFALEPRVAADPDVYLDWLAAGAQDRPLVSRHLVSRIVRRVSDIGSDEAIQKAVAFTAKSASDRTLGAALDGLAAALEGERHTPPPSWPILLHRVRTLRNSDYLWKVVRIGASFRDRSALEALSQYIRDRKMAPDRRREAIKLFAEASGPSGHDLLLAIAADRNERSDLRREALFWLSRSGDRKVAEKLLNILESLDERDRQTALQAFATRREWAKLLLAAISRGQVDRDWITAPVAERMARLGADIEKELTQVWGQVRKKTPAELEKEINRWIVLLRNGRGNPERGRQIFLKKCGVCHTFKGEGEKLAPDLTGADRSVGYLITNIVDPNRVVGIPYYQHVVATRSGQVITGKLAQETKDAIVLELEEGRRVTIPRDEIEQHVVRPISVMPEGLLQDLSEQDVRDLIEYLRR